MARNLEFDRDAVLNAAMEVFWTQGYRATSMVDLEHATGLRPGSIYNSFESKKGLFLAAIGHYRKQIVEMRIESILNEGAPIEGIEAFFRTTYEGFEPDKLIGCMLTNTATELSDDDAEIQAQVAGGVSSIEAGFKVRLEEARHQGDLDNGRDVSAAALHLTSCYQGLCVIGRLTRDMERLKVITDQAIATLK